MAVALIVPLTFYLPNPNTGLALILGISFSAIFAGDIPAIYLRIPGTPASAAGALDGHELARQGRGRFALALDLLCSCVGGLIGVTLLILMAPQQRRWIRSGRNRRSLRNRILRCRSTSSRRSRCCRTW
jgi:TctA family transporter